MKFIIRAVPTQLDNFGNITSAFMPIEGFDAKENNLEKYISATANSMGSYSLYRFIQKYNWKANWFELEHKCNKENSIVLVDNLHPQLVLVPKTHQSPKNPPEPHITSLLKLFVNKKVILHLTHYAFVLNQYPTNEIEKILSAIEDNPNKQFIDTIYWDIDKRFISDFLQSITKIMPKQSYTTF